MFWDKIAIVYDLFETIYNKKVYKNLGPEVAKEISPTDCVLECACGTGIISKSIATKCNKLIASDYSKNMLKKAKKKCKKYTNVDFVFADIMNLDYNDNTFDKVIAGNVIHLLNDPFKAVKELERVCKSGGKIILPTYINMEKKGKPNFLVRAIDKSGANFKRQFTLTSYKEFFKNMGYKTIKYDVVNGKMPCSIAIITKD